MHSLLQKLFLAGVSLSICLLVAAISNNWRWVPRQPQGYGGALGELRNRLLTGTADGYGVQPVGDTWGVLMETGHPEGTATLVALGDGTTSLYLSTGGGVIGGGEHEKVNLAARVFVERASERAVGMDEVDGFPVPVTGRVTFYVLTTSGVRAAEAEVKELQAGTHPLAPLFRAGHDVLGLLHVPADETTLDLGFGD